MKPNATIRRPTIQQANDRSVTGALLGSLRILIADDHDLIRRGVRTLVKAHPGWEVCGEARTGLEAVEKAKGLNPAIVVMDVSMPGLNGIEAAKQIRRASPRVEILILSLHYSDQLIRDIVEAGIRGYVIKSDSDRDLVAAIETLANHGAFITPLATEIMLTHFNEGQVHDRKKPWRERLTPRQREIVGMIGEGKSTKELASILDVSLKTAETHRANIMRRLRFHNISEIVRYAIRNHALESESLYE